MALAKGSAGHVGDQRSGWDFPRSEFAPPRLELVGMEVENNDLF
jgi:hypothetical protein